MAFRYINPGYAELLSGKGMYTTENFDYNPENGIAFTANIHNDFVEIMPAGYFSDEVHCKFDLYSVGDPYYGDAFRMGLAHYNYANDSSMIMGIGTRDGYGYIYYNGQRIKNTSKRLKPEALNSISFSLNLQKLTVSLTVNDETITASNLSSTTYYGTDSSFKVSLPKSGNVIYYISNLIISEEYIFPKERVITLPIKQTFTDMTAGDSGMYIADAANQTLLQSPDVAALIQDYGADSTITGIALSGNPAYRTGEAIASLTGLLKSGENISEHNTVALSDDTTASVMDGWGLSGVTISDLQNMQFGWKVGE